jgi:tetraprenyl-beta-curcumene synthase
MAAYKYYMNTAVFMYKYAGRILPEAERLLDGISIGPRADNTGAERGGGDSDKVRSSLDLHCFCLFALYPGLDIGNALSFIAAFHALADHLDMLCRRSGAPDEVSVRKLYPALQDAVDPEHTTGSYQHDYSLKEGKQLKQLVDQCRLRITALPSYKLVTGKMKKYVQLYTDLQAYRYLPPGIRREYVESWADNYLMRYRGISVWEFSAAADSLLGVCSMFAAAGDPKLTPEDVKALDEAYFPWVCGLHKLLDSYISAREDILTGRLNFTGCYDNLRACEERLSFFIGRASALCPELKNPEYHIHLLKYLLSFYLSDSRAYFGMYGIATRKIIAGSPLPTGLYRKTCRLLRRISAL